eukprot:gene16071-12815_t
MAAEGPTACEDRHLYQCTVMVGDPPRLELACGAFVCAQRNATVVAKQVKAAKGWAGSVITKYNEAEDGRETLRETKQLAVHLSAEGAACMQNAGRAAEIPQGLQALIDHGTCVWHGGLRVESLSCRGNQRDVGFTPTPAAQPVSSGSTAPSTSTPTMPPTPRQGQASFRFCELFAGIGGFRLGLEPLGGTCVFASELELSVRRLYEAAFNHGCDEMDGDISHIPTARMPQFDLLTAGFPCQSWSVEGNMAGFGDPRGALFFEISRILRHKQPAGFLLENVPNLVEVGGGGGIRFIVNELELSGYTVQWRVLSSRPLVPQRRLRLYFVGFLSAAAAAAFSWPEWADDGEADAKERESSPGMPRPTEAARGWPVVGQILEPMLEQQTAEGNAAWERLALSQRQWNAVCSHEAKNRQLKSLWRRMVNVDGAARTLIGSYRHGFHRQSQFVLPLNGAGLVTVAIDTATATATSKEVCARLQGFPDDFVLPAGSEGGRDEGSLRLYHMIGNAVCPLVVQSIADQMLKAGLLGRTAT